MHLTAQGHSECKVRVQVVPAREKPEARVKGANKNTASRSQVWHRNEDTRSGIGKPSSKTLTDSVKQGRPITIFRCPMLSISRKYFSNVRQKLSRLEGDEMLDVEVNGMIWRLFMSATMKAAVHLGQDYEENLRTTKNPDFEQVKHLFDVSQKLNLNQSEEIFGISVIDWKTIPCLRTTLLHDRAVELSKSKGTRFL